jgi:hypothetical protein
MIHPPESHRHYEAVRDGRVGPVTCATCGCRLEQVGPDRAAAYFHFSPLGGRDARGCRIECVELPHDVRGVAAQLVA